MVPAIILAAGRSTRMGRPKPLLPAGGDGEVFVVRLARACMAGGTTGVTIVGRPDDEDLRRVVAARLDGARWVANPRADQGGALSSLLAGLGVVDDGRIPGVLMAPVDAPRVAASTIAALLEAFGSAPGRIVRAVHAGRHGHPVIFPRALFDELRAADPAVGAKGVVRAHAVLDVDAGDAAVVEDIDTREAYRAAFGDDV